MDLTKRLVAWLKPGAVALLLVLSAACTHPPGSPSWQTVPEEAAAVPEAQQQTAGRLTTAEQDWFAEGSRHYQYTCAMCHGWDGMGDDRAPPLVGSKRVSEAPGKLVRIVLHGLQGESLMPPHLLPSDSLIAAVLTYVRLEYGHGAGPVDAEFVRAVRGRTLGRDRPWTAEELDALSGE